MAGIFWLVISLSVTSVLAEDIAVETNVGTFIGFTDEIVKDGTKISLSKFLGIPYAEAPTGDLRFRKPVEKTRLKEPLEVKKHGKPCMQMMVAPYPLHGSEDCLFLNVYAPVMCMDCKEKLPVMIWIHGGAFVMGSGQSYVPDQLAANGPVIVVTLNYRLSIWGFLTTGDSNSRGNYGLWDQHLAIKWVHDNIDKFGGDPNRVTIFGESAGSMSVVYQGIYPGNSGLFQRIIGQSGSPVAQWGADRDPVLEVREFSKIVGCESDDIRNMVDCLRGLDNSVINGTLNDVSNGFAFRPIFFPYTDGVFIEKLPQELVRKACDVSAPRNTFAGFDLLLGVTSGEGYLFTPPGPMQVEAWETFLPNASFFKESLVPQFMQYLQVGQNCDLLTQAVVAEYTDWEDPDNPEKIREKFTDMTGDIIFLAPVRLTIDFHASITQRQSSYMYYFTANPENHALPTPSWATRPNHGDDIIYMFGGEGDLSEFGINELPKLADWEKELANNVMTMWTNFAKTGNPNRPRDLEIDWLPYTNSHQHYLDISKKLTPRNVKTRLENRRANFWNNLVPAMINKCKETARESKGTCAKDGDCAP